MARRFSLVVIAAAAVLAGTLPANADTFPGTGLVADDSIYDYCLNSSFSTDVWVAHDAASTLDDTTDMTDSYTTCVSYTDAWWFEADLDPGVRGLTYCVSEVSPGVCDSNDILMDIAEIDAGSNDWYDRRKTSVHEQGHTIGLDHDTESAMISGEVPSTSTQWRTYSSHDVGHINTQY